MQVVFHTEINSDHSERYHRIALEAPKSIRQSGMVLVITTRGSTYILFPFLICVGLIEKAATYPNLLTVSIDSVE